MRRVISGRVVVRKISRLARCKFSKCAVFRTEAKGESGGGEAFG